MGAGRKRKAAPWDKAKGWKQVQVGDDLMLGSTESGFMGLEVLEPEETLLFGNYKRQADPTTEDGDDESVRANLDAIMQVNEQSEGPSVHKKKKAKVADSVVAKTADQEPTKAKTAASGNDKLALLTAKIAALEAENLALKKSSTPDAAAKPAKKQKAAKAAKRTAAAKPTAAAAPADAESEDDASEAVDITAWSDFNLHPKIAQAIRQAGFSQPTPIQEQCLLPAIRDRRDVIGAAQTVSAADLAMHA